MNGRVLLTSAMLCILGSGSAHAGLVLSFDPQGATTVSLGSTIDVDLVLTQTAPIADADITVDGLTFAQVPLILTGAAFSTSSISVNPGFNFDISSVDTFQAGVLSFPPLLLPPVTAPVGDPTSVTLGTFTFNAGNAGTTILTTNNTGMTQFSFGGTSSPGDIDNQIFGAETLTLTATATAVPEPSGFLMWGLIASVSGTCVYCKRRFRYRSEASQRGI